MEKTKAFCEGFIFSALEMSGLIGKYGYEVVMDGEGMQKVVLTREECMQDEEHLILVDDLQKLNKIIIKTKCIEFYDKQLFLDTKSGKLIIR